MEKVILTTRGERILREKLKHLREVERPNNVRDIEEARAHGDLSENAEYHAAKDRQGFIEGQMRELEDKLGRAEVIEPSRLSGERVVFGATVVLFNLETDEPVTYQLVGPDEADIDRGWISVTAPIGRALLGKRQGDTIEVKAPGGVREYQVEEVRFE